MSSPFQKKEFNPNLLFLGQDGMEKKVPSS